MKERVSRALHNIFKTNLGIKPSNSVLVFTDAYNRSIKKTAERVALAGEKFSDNIRYVESSSTGCHGVEPPEELWIEAYGKSAVQEIKKEKLFKSLLTKKIKDRDLKVVEDIIRVHKKDSVHAVIALSYFSTSHTKFRDMLNRICRAKYASMPLFDENMLSGVMQVNWAKMLKRSSDIKRIINRYEEIEIKSDNGTFITFSKKGRKAMADTGIITKPGSFSNLPAGEVYLAPLEGTAEGTLVLQWAPTRKLKSPVILRVEKGTVRSVEGDEKFVGQLKKKLSEKKENRNIAELGIGTNDKATRPDNILESEKILGTIHIALGDNSSFGGRVRTSFHQDFVFFKPTVTLISKGGRRRDLLKKGKVISNN
jgi:leucyl aminopeptidase (aminopeptidase T)